MITEEPRINVGILEQRREISGKFNGLFCLNDGCLIDGVFRACVETDQVILFNAAGTEVTRQKEIHCSPINNSTFTLSDVTIGIHFHWERNQEQIFCGSLILISGGNKTLTAINALLLEEYLVSVISSEMSAEAPIEFLKAHAIMSRSWIAALLQRPQGTSHPDEGLPHPLRCDNEIIRWYGRVDHTSFNVCADDHCQRYQGITRLISENARHAVHATRGLFLIHNNEICDARYHKACGGLTDRFESAWEDMPVPYLRSVSDSRMSHNPIITEADAERWISSNPEAYCNTRDENILRQILPSYDQETPDFFRWKVVYAREELEAIIREKSGIDFGHILNLIPLERGPSGRVIRMRIEGSRKIMIVGKELEIRRWLSPTHLYSSAFIVSTERDTFGNTAQFILHGAGWGHGIGLCQIGAAVMATKGCSAGYILKHYFTGAEIKELY
jgi:stage II sporulation protein D